MKKIVLASKSIDRKEILERSKIPFEVLSIDVDEEPYKAKIFSPIELIRKLSEIKALHAKDLLIKQKKDAIIIAADTIVVFENEIIGKGNDEKEAFRILKKLSGQTHELMTGITITETSSSSIIIDHDITQVEFLNLSDDEIWGYIRTGEWRGRAGAYSLRERASIFIKSIRGSPSNVIGLPMHKLYAFLKNNFALNLLTVS
ncbi:MAG: Maf family protein [Promethearchaeota archaeon]